jgi:hypothetical protein
MVYKALVTGGGTGASPVGSALGLNPYKLKFSLNSQEL